MADTLEDRVTALESTAYRQGQHLDSLDTAVVRINGKLDDLSGQVRDVRLSVRELGDRLADVEARLTGIETRQEEHSELLRRIVAKLEA